MKKVEESIDSGSKKQVHMSDNLSQTRGGKPIKLLVLS